MYGITLCCRDKYFILKNKLSHMFKEHSGQGNLCSLLFFLFFFVFGLVHSNSFSAWRDF